MEKFRALTLTYCLACLAAGVLRVLVPAGDGQRVIKAVSGLYILLAVLYALGNGQLFWSGASGAAQPAAVPQESYAQAVLAQAQTQLEQDCEAQLARAGVQAQTTFLLAQQTDGVAVQRITVAVAGQLSPERQRQAQDILAGYAPRQIDWQSEAAAP